MKELIQKLRKQARLMRYGYFITRYGYSPYVFACRNKVPFFASSVGSRGTRYNLVIPSLEENKMYGGILTAIDFFSELVDRGFDARIIVQEEVSEAARTKFSGWTWMESSSDESAARILTSTHSSGEAPSALAVRENDIFITTTWLTHFTMADVCQFQQKQFDVTHPLVYFIQDFEPGFFEWSAQYMLAESTYHTPGTIAIFNSVQLHSYFTRLGYSFAYETHFSPRLNKEMAEWRRTHQGAGTVRRNQIVFYGRPARPRNCFPLIIEAINLFIAKYPDVAKRWDFISIGASLGSFKLRDGRRLHSRGKMSLADYAGLLSQTKVGISLMCSPHPSYPPLEMASFGLVTITNQFVDKDLQSFSPNIISLETLTLETLCEAMYEATRRADRGRGETPAMDSFLLPNDQFSSIIDFIVGIVDQEMEAK